MNIGIAYLVGDGLKALADARLTVRHLDRAERVLGASPDRPDSAATARDLAMAAYRDALSRGGTLGIGLCAGPRRLLLGLQDRHYTKTYEAIIGDGTVAERARSLLDQALAFDPQGDAIRGEPAWVALVHGEAAVVCCSEGPIGPPRVLYPGSFHPFHGAHARLAEVAHRRTRRPVDFELSVTNVDKPPLNYHAIAERVAGVRSWKAPHHGSLWLTSAPTFLEKARLFPQPLTFVVGMDTLLRIGDPRYYLDRATMAAALDELGRDLGCRFLAFPRAGAEAGKALPSQLRAITEFVPIAEVRDVLTIASRDIRRLRPVD
jgi:hypothetical protein